MADPADGPAAQDHALSVGLHAPPYPASWLDQLFDWVRKA